MSECTSLDEYNEKQEANSWIVGSGNEAMVHTPCPFCGEPDFMVHQLADTNASYVRGALCNHCHRGVRRIFNVGEVGWTSELVLTAGPNIPSFLRPIRRQQ